MWNKHFIKKISRTYRIYLGFEDQDVSYSDNFGANWTTYTGSYTSPLQVIYIRGEGLPNFAGGTYWNLYMGTSLVNLNSFADVGIGGVWKVIYNPRTLYHYCVNNIGLYRSLDGSSWGAVANFGANLVALMIYESLWITGSSTNGIYLSINSGANVSNYTTSQGLGSNTVNDIILAGGVIWAATAGGISKSTNNGAAWTNYTTTQGIIHNNVTGVCYSEPRKRIYCVSNNATTGGISYTDNGGTNWSTITVTASNLLLGCQMIDNIIFVWGTGGMAYSVDGGLTFVNRTTAIPSTNIRVCHVLGTTTFG